MSVTVTSGSDSEEEEEQKINISLFVIIGVIGLVIVVFYRRGNLGFFVFDRKSKIDRIKAEINNIKSNNGNNKGY